MWGEYGGNGGTGEKSMLGRIRGFDDDKESVVGSENGGGWVSGRSELFPLADNISKQVQSPGSSAAKKKKEFF